MGAVLFKPTLTVAPQTFRTTHAGALACFVGGDIALPKDTGFALKGWTKCDIANSAIFIAGDPATTMGNVSITGKDGKITTVDKTWRFVKDDAGKLRIVVHHSSFPCTGSWVQRRGRARIDKPVLTCAGICLFLSAMV
jgi:hypothetical protein